MAKKGKALVSGAGLTPADRKLLRDCLAELELILDIPHMLGAHEADQAFALRRRLSARLEPEEPAKLATDAKAFTDLFGPTVQPQLTRKRQRPRSPS